MILIHMRIYNVSEKSLNGRITPETHITLKTGNIYVKYFLKSFSEVSVFIPSTDPMGRGVRGGSNFEIENDNPHFILRIQISRSKILNFCV